MQRAPLQFLSIICKHCGAIVALVPPGTFLYTTRLRCAHCSAVRTIQAMDSNQPESSALETVAPA